jgi:hypothetical protein
MITLTREEAEKMLHYMDDGGTYTDDYGKLIETFRARLSAPEPEYRDVVIKGDLWRIEFLPDHAASVVLARANYEAQPEPEPVAWMYEYGTDHGDAVNQIFWHKNLRLEKPDGMVRNVVPLYTAPPQREWQGLTDEEIREGNRESWVTTQAWQSAVWWAEERLKEKNT